MRCILVVLLQVFLIQLKEVMASRVWCVNSGSRGIGLEFVNQLLSRPSTTKVYAFLRDVNSPMAIKMKEEYKDRYIPVQVDNNDQETIERLPGMFTQSLKSGEKIDGLINVAGILGGRDGDLGPERSIQSIDRKWLEQSVDTNLVGHVMVTQAIIPFMKRTKKVEIDSNPPAKIVNLSARVGSISDNSLGGWYSYRMSKAALNMFTKTSSIELKRWNIFCMSIHPGTTDTDLSKPFQKNIKPDTLLTVQQSVQKMLNVIDSKQDMGQTGSFYAYDGSKIEW